MLKEDVNLAKKAYLGNIENLVFQGGGPAGFAHAGALYELFPKFLKPSQIQRVAGASAGALIALLIALGFDIVDSKKDGKTIDNILGETKMIDLLDEVNPRIPEINIKKLLTTILKLKIAASKQNQINSVNSFSKLLIYHVVDFAKGHIQTVLRNTFGRIKQTIAGKVIKKLHALLNGALGVADLDSEARKKFYTWLQLNIVNEASYETLDNFLGECSVVLFAFFLPSNFRTFIKGALSDERMKQKIKIFEKMSGLFPGDVILAKIKKWIVQAGFDENITFEELHEIKELKQNGKDLYVVAYNMSCRSSKLFSHKHTPGVSIADAVRASISIPFFFAPHPIVIDGCAQHYMDGGILDNYPISIFDKAEYCKPNYKFPNDACINQRTLGFRIIAMDEFKKLFPRVKGGEFKHLYPNITIDKFRNLFPDSEAQIKKIWGRDYKAVKLEKIQPKKNQSDNNNSDNIALENLRLDEKLKVSKPLLTSVLDLQDSSFMKILKSIAGGYYQKKNNDSELFSHKFRTIYSCNAGVSLVDFKLSNALEASLFISGVKGVGSRYIKALEARVKAEKNYNNLSISTEKKFNAVSVIKEACQDKIDNIKKNQIEQKDAQKISISGKEYAVLNKDSNQLSELSIAVNKLNLFADKLLQDLQKKKIIPSAV